MTDDLSTRLLAAIEKIERRENSRYSMADSMDCDRCGTTEDPETVTVETVTTGDDYDVVTLSCGHEISYSDVPSVPAPDEAALRFCRAHREIVELHLVCQVDYALAAEKAASLRGEWMSIAKAKAAAEAEDAADDALIRLQFSDHILSIVALGYGIQDGDAP